MTVMIPATLQADPPGEDLEALARSLEASGQFRIRRRLTLPIVTPRPAADGERTAIILDTETNGLDDQDELIELAMVKIAYRPDGTISGVIDQFQQLQEPVQPLKPDVVKITGITAEMLAGHKIDVAAVEAFIADSDLIIAHNAKFDRPKCERLSPVFATKQFVCSAFEIKWIDHGFRKSALEHLIDHMGLFHDAHRGVPDCLALVHVLSQPLSHGRSAFADVLTAAERVDGIVWALNSPYATKDLLKARGYRWSGGENGTRKAWWRSLKAHEIEDELTFLRTTIYPGQPTYLVENVTSRERHSRRV